MGGYTEDPSTRGHSRWDRGRTAAGRGGPVHDVPARHGCLEPDGLVRTEAQLPVDQDGDLQRPAAKRIAVELPNRLVRRLGRRHLDETESARLATVAVRHDRDGVDAVDLVEELAEFLGRRAERKTTDEKFLPHY